MPAVGEAIESDKATRHKLKRVGRPTALDKRHIRVLRGLATQEPGVSRDASGGPIRALARRPRPPARIERRVLVETCCHVLRMDCAWRLLQTSFPAWTTVYKSFERWAATGRFERMYDRLRVQWRERLGRHAQPTAAVLDSQATRHSPQGGEAGFDAGKKIKGRKRHLLVDTLGLLLVVSVTSASVQDRDGAPPMVAVGCAKAPELKLLYVDGAYGGQCAQASAAERGSSVDIVRHPGNRNAHVFQDRHQPAATAELVPAGFVVLPKHWVVERTHAWNERWRCLDVLPAGSTDRD